jgi:putative redox protein
MEDRMTEPQSPMSYTVTHLGGRRFASQIRRHTVVTDQSVRAGGDDSAPSPPELISAALGSCIAVYVHQFCESRGLPHDGMRVVVTPSSAPGERRIAGLAVRVCLPTELPAHEMEMLERVVRSCPVHNTLTHGAGVSVEIGAGTTSHVACG